MLNYLWVLLTVEELIKNASRKKFSHATSQVLFKQTKRQTTKKLERTRQHTHLNLPGFVLESNHSVLKAQAGLCTESKELSTSPPQIVNSSIWKMLLGT